MLTLCKRYLARLASVAVLVLSSGLLPGVAHAEWLKAETEHFIVYGDVSERSLQDYARKVERFDALLRLWWPPADPGLITPRLSIYLADGRPDMVKIWPGMPDNVGGFYTPGASRIFAVTGGQGPENDHTLFHEYAHHYMHQYMTAAYPGWFVEGFAEFFATADMTPGRTRVGLESAGRMYSLAGGGNSWLPMATVLRSRSLEIGNRGHLYYAQSWAMTSWFMSTPERRALLGRYLGAVLAGGDPVTSLEAATGMTPNQLQDDVRRYVGTRINYLSERREFPPAEVTVTRLPKSTGDLIWLDLRLARYVPEDRRAGNLAEAQRLATRYPGDPLAARVLAQAHLDMQQNADAVRVMDAAVAASPENAENLLMLANALMDLGDAASEGEDTDGARRVQLYGLARSALSRAYQVDAIDFRIYLALSRSRQFSAGFPTDNDLETLRAGVQLAPQVQDMSLRAAQALMARGQYAEAIQYLIPVANNPHGGAGLQPVRNLLAEARLKAGVAGSDDDTPPPAEGEASALDFTPDPAS